MRRGRGLAVFVAAVVSVALVGGCGGSSKAADLAADRKVESGNRLDAARADRAATEHRLEREREAALLAARGPTPSTEPPTPTVLKLLGFTLDDLCAPLPRGRGRAQRREQRALEHRRKLAFYYLNLSCAPGASR